MEDGVPVGVMIPPVEGRGYQILGLGLVQEYDSGHFKIVGPVSVRLGELVDLAGYQEPIAVAFVESAASSFDPHAETDSRQKVLREIALRQGGPRFRKALITAYEGRCTVTRYDATGALEAAHIMPYRGPQTNHPTNGLLLRADMHDLFDLGLVAVDVDSMRLRLAAPLEGTRYERYEGVELWLPRDPVARPNVEALQKHRELSSVS